MPPPRIYSFDVLKILAIFGVIVFHTYPFAGINSEFYRLYRNFWGFNVPVFFIISGYLLAFKIRLGDGISLRYGKNIKRLVFLLLAWSAIYLTIPLGNFSHGLAGAFLAGWQESFRALINHPAAFLGDGVRYHLWFIIALITALAISYPFVRARRLRELCAVAAGFYLVGLLTGAYAWSPLGFGIGFDTRDGPFQALLFVALGILLARKGYRPSVKTAFMVLGAGLVAQMAEVALLYSLIPRSEIVGGEYYLGTVPYALGLVLLALAIPDLGKRIKVEKVAPYVLGVYMIHYVVITYVIKGTYGGGDILWQIIYPPIVFLLSLLVAISLSRIPLVRRLVIARRPPERAVRPDPAAHPPLPI